MMCSLMYFHRASTLSMNVSLGCADRVSRLLVSFGWETCVVDLIDIAATARIRCMRENERIW